MLIQKTLPARLGPAPEAIQALISKLLSLNLPELTKFLAQFEWNLPKSDLWHFVGVLDRFDGILAEFIRTQIPLATAKEKEQQDEQRKKESKTSEFYGQNISVDLVIGILRIQRALWEQCVNRGVFNGYDRLNSLLLTDNVDILEHTLRLVLRPAQRTSAQKSLKQGMQILSERLSVLALSFHEFGDLKTVDLEDSTAESLRFEFYRHFPVDVASGDGSTSNSRESMQLSTPSVTPAATPSKKQSASGTEVREGLVVVDLSLRETEKSLSEIIEKHAIPEKDHFALFHKLRVFKSRGQERKRLFCLWLYSLACLLNLLNEDELYSKLMVYQPDFVADIVALLKRNDADYQLNTPILYVLESMIKFKSRIGDVLLATGASVNHGLMMQLLKNCINAMHDTATAFPQEYTDAIFALTSPLMTSQTGGPMLISAGLVRVLLSALSIDVPEQYKNVSKCIICLDNLNYAFPAAHNTFVHQEGVDSFVKKIQEEVGICESLKLEQMDVDQGSSNEQMEIDDKKTEFPSERTLLLRSMLKLILHLMQSFGTSDSLRNLIDSTLPDSIGAIFRNAKDYGAGVYGISISIMATFIHNEPTSLAILQESKLPGTFLDSVMANFPVSAEVITAIPNAFGAVCLNQAGLEEFSRVRPMGKYLGVLIDKKNIQSLTDNDVSVVIGNSIDEFMRHHPSTKPEVFEAIHGVLKQATLLEEPPLCLLVPGVDEPKSEMSQIVDILTRFLEGLFQNATHCKEFIKLGMFDLLMKLVSSPAMAYDFASSNYSYALSNIVRVVWENNAQVVIASLGPLVAHAADLITSFSKTEPLYKMVHINDRQERSQDYNKVYRALIFMSSAFRAVSDCFASPNSRMINATLEGFSSDEGKKLLADLSNFFLVANWQNVLLKHHLPKKLFEKTSTPAEKEEAWESENAKRLRFLLAQTSILMPIFAQYLVKIVGSRRISEKRAKYLANQITEQIGNILKTQIAFDVGSDEVGLALTYQIMAYGNLHSLVSDERGASGLQTQVLFAFVMAGGLDVVLGRMEALWKALRTQELKEEEKEKTCKALELLMGFVALVTDSHALMNSTNTQVAVNREQDRKSPFFFNPHVFLVNVRLKVLETLANLMQDDEDLTKVASVVVKNLFEAMKNIAKAEEENADVDMKRSFASAISSLTAQIRGQSFIPRATPAVVITEESVNALVEMGFSNGAARQALTRTRGNLERAAEYLLLHPELNFPEPVAPQLAPAPAIEAQQEQQPQPVDLDVDMDAAQEDAEDDYEDEEEEEEESAALEEALASLQDATNMDVGPADGQLEKLNQLRASLVEKSKAFALKALDQVDGVVFEVKEFLMVLEKENLDSFVSSLVAGIQSRQVELSDVSQTNEQTKKAFSNRLRLFAMLASDASIQNKVILASGGYISSLVTALDQGIGGLDYAAVSSLLLVIASYISLSEEPTPVALTYSDNTGGSIEELNLPEKLSDDQQKVLVRFLKRQLGPEKVEADLLNSVYRLLVRLTRTPSLAVVFMEDRGVSLLFKRKHLATFPGQQDMTAMILRHLVETSSILGKIMKTEITEWLTFPRVRSLDINTFLKNANPYICRSQEAFLAAAAEVCKAKYSTNPRNVQITSIQKKKEDEGSKTEEDETNESLVSVAHLMVSELLALRHGTPTKPQQTQTGEDEDTAREDHIKRCTLLQVLEEMAASYLPFKKELISSGSKKQKTPVGKSSSRNHFLSYLLNELVPNGYVLESREIKQQPQKDTRFSEANYASSLLLSLCSFGKTDDSASIELCVSAVLDAIARSMREALSSDGLLDVKYARYGALAQLVYDIPTAKDVTASGASAANSASKTIAKLMLEKNFVTALTLIAADVDVKHPDANTVLRTILKPIEYLSSQAQRIEDLSVFPSGSMDEHIPDDDEGSDEDDEEGSEHSGIHEITRHSALNMFESEMSASSDGDMDADGDSIGEDEVLEFDGFESGDSQDDHEIESDVEDDMEIVVPAPFRGENDDEDEDDMSESDQDSQDDDSDSMDDDSDSEIDHAEGEQVVVGEEEEMWETEDEEEQGDDQEEEEEEDDDDAQVVDGEPWLDFEEEENGAGEGGVRIFGGDGRHIRGFPQLGRIGGDLNDGLEIQWEVAPSGGASLNFLRGGMRRVNDVAPHPLLRTETEPTPLAGGAEDVGARDMTNIIRAGSGDRLDYQAFQSLIGGSALQVLEQLLSRATGGQQGGRIEIAIGRDQAQNSDLDLVEQPTADATAAAAADERLASVHGFNALKTTDRWSQQARFLYGSQANEKSARLRNALLNLLMPAALAEEKERVEKERKEKEEQQQREKERKEKEQKEKEQQKQQEEQSSEEQPQQQPQTQVFVMLDGVPVDITGSGMDPEFINALPEDLREEVVTQYLQDQRAAMMPGGGAVPENLSQEFLDALPFEIRQEVIQREREEQERRNQPAGQPRVSRERNEAAAPAPEKKKTKSPQLIEKPGIVSLMRLLYVPEDAHLDLAHRALTNFAQNPKSRAEIVSFLLNVLMDQGAAVETRKSPTPSKKRPLQAMQQQASSSLSSLASSSTPNLVTERSLDLLFHMVSTSSQLCRYFLIESEFFSSTYARTLSATGGGQKTPKKIKSGSSGAIAAGGSNKYPIVVLLQLLSRPGFVSGNIELLMHILSLIMRSLTLLMKKPKASSPVADSGSLEEQDQKKEEKVEDKQGEVLATASDTNKEVAKPAREEYKPPNLPADQIRAIVRVLTSDECSNRAFQYTLSVIQQLCLVQEYRDIVTKELVNATIQTAGSLQKDLNQLEKHLAQLPEDQEVDTDILTRFSSPASDQAKLLRLYKTMDFLYLRKTDAALQSAAAAEVYSKFDFEHLWSSLGSCLTYVNKQESNSSVATVLLPLIEAYMVAAKPHVTKSPESKFLVFIDTHKRILNNMVRNNPTLMNGSFGLLVHCPKVLEFDNKRTYFTQQIKRKARREQYGNINLNVRRQYVFEDSYHQLQGRPGDEIRYGKLMVKFQGEEGVDAGGVTREWFSVLARQMFNPDYALFKPSAADQVTYQPNRSSWINPEHLSYFRFTGRVIGKAIFDGRLLDAYFTRSFYKCMLGIPVDWRDMEAVDPEFHKSLEWMMNNDITDILDLTFSCEVDEFGTRKIIDLIPDGRNVPVTEDNKMEYVRLITEQKLVVAIKQQIDAFLGGFHDIISADMIKIFNEQELELLISGLPDIDIDDWKANTEYQNYTLSSPQIQWFWRAVRSFSQEERAKLLQFVTGTSKVPLEGFARLQGSNGLQKFQIHKDFGPITRLPSAHTCFNQLDIPQYETYEQLRSQLLLAISECGTGFGFA